MEHLNSAHSIVRDGFAPMTKMVELARSRGWRVLPSQRITADHIDPEAELEKLEAAVESLKLCIGELNAALSLQEAKAVPATHRLALEFTEYYGRLYLMHMHSLLLNPMDQKDPGRVLLRYSLERILAQITEAVEIFSKQLDEPTERSPELTWNIEPVAELGALLQWRDARELAQSGGRKRGSTAGALAAGGFLGLLAGWLLSGGSDE